MSEEENEESNNEGEENEDEENEGDEEGEEKEDDENGDEEGEEEEDDNEGEENEDEEGEEKEDDEDDDDEDKKKKTKKSKKKDNKKEEKKTGEEKPQQTTKFTEEKLLPSKEIKMDLNLNSSNSNNIYFNGNDITLANITPPKKSTIQLLLEISSDMDNLSTHLEKVLPPPTPPLPMKYNIDYPIYNAPIDIKNLDNQDIEIKKLIDRANEMTNPNNSILNIKSNKSIENGEIKTYEDKCCQSDDEIENSYNQQLEENRSRQEEEYYNNNNYNNNRRRFPYDPYKHIDYYNDLRNNNDNYYRRRPFIYSQQENNNNNYIKRNDIPFERYKPGNISQAMDILLDKK